MTMQTQTYELSDEDLAVLQEASEKVHERLAGVIADFITHCLNSEMTAPVAGAGVSQYLLFNLVRALSVCSGMATADIDEHDEAVKILTMRIQKHIMVKVSEFVRTHMPEEDLYVSPDDRKLNDAAERADYEYDRDKEERRGKS